MTPTDFAKALTDYLGHYLPNECGLTRNTMQAYSVTFTLLLRYLETEEGLRPEQVRLQHLTKPRLIAFLEWLETDRHCGVATRNARLATLHSFCRYLQYRQVQGLALWQDLLSIRFKRGITPPMAYLTPEALTLVLQQPDRRTSRGRRDLALLGLLYDSAARVQELADLTPAALCFDRTTTVTLTGKGRKSRTVPLAESQVKNLRQYMQEHALLTPQASAHPLFPNPQQGKLSRAAILALVKKYTAQARQAHGAIIPEGLGCHSLRHSKAMHMLAADINLIYIRDFLGHASTTTTEVYARASAEHKRAALQKLNPTLVPEATLSWHRDTHLLHWLKDLQRQSANIM